MHYEVFIYTCTYIIAAATSDFSLKMLLAPNTASSTLIATCWFEPLSPCSLKLHLQTNETWREEPLHWKISVHMHYGRIKQLSLSAFGLEAGDRLLFFAETITAAGLHSGRRSCTRWIKKGPGQRSGEWFPPCSTEQIKLKERNIHKSANGYKLRGNTIHHPTRRPPHKARSERGAPPNIEPLPPDVSEEPRFLFQPRSGELSRRGRSEK